MWSLSTVVGTSKINKDKKCRQIAGTFYHHADAAVQCGAHCQMEHIPGFTRSHWMLPLGKCLCHITPAAAMVSNFGVKHKARTNITFG
jgi:hypothetical protein